MSDLSGGARANLILNPGDVYRVSGSATVQGIYGAPATTTTLTNESRDFGPYDAPAKLVVTNTSGVTSYVLLQNSVITRSPATGQLDEEGAEAVYRTRVSLIATGAGGIPTFASGRSAVAGVDCASAHWATERITRFTKIGWTSQYSVQETGCGGTISIQAAIEYPLGTLTPILFNGGLTGVIPTSGVLYCDSVEPAVPIPMGAKFFIRQWLAADSSVTNFPYYRDTSARYHGADTGEYYAAYTGSVVDAGNNTNNVYNATRPIAASPQSSTRVSYRPAIILGDTNKATFGLVGDSIVCADYSFYRRFDGLPYTGVAERKVAERFACVKLAANGDSYNSIIGPNTNNIYTTSAQWNRFRVRRELGRYCSHILDELGTNDAAITKDAFITNMTAMAGQFPDAVYGHTTLLPNTTSTDYWQTDANQTIPGSAANRDQYNDAVRNLVPPVSFYVDCEAAVRSGTNRRLWRAPSPIGRSVTDLVTTGASATVTSATAKFSTNDLYKRIAILNAVTGGVYTVFTIITINSATSIVLDANVTNTNAATTGILGALTEDGLHPSIEAEALIHASNAFDELLRMQVVLR